MSKIISKPFNKSKRILRAVFQGSPNLFTTSDLNRQIEAFSTRISDMETQMYNGVITDLRLLLEATGDDCKVTYNMSYLELFGCTLHSGSDISGNLIDLIKVGDTLPLFLWFTTSKIGYSEDATHEISGVKFEDGTSKEAADHLVINSWGLTSDALKIPVNAERISLCTDIRIVEYEGIELFYTPTWKNTASTISKQLFELRKDVDSVSTLLQTTKKSGRLEDYVVTRPLQRSDVSVDGDVYMSLSGLSLNVIVDCTLTSDNSLSEGETLEFFIPLTRFFTEEDLELLNAQRELSGSCLMVNTQMAAFLGFLWYTPTVQGGGDMNPLPEYTKYLVIRFTALKALDYVQQNARGNVVVMR